MTIKDAQHAAELRNVKSLLADVALLARKAGALSGELNNTVMQALTEYAPPLGTMTAKETALLIQGTSQSHPLYRNRCLRLWEALSGSQREVLRQLVDTGPVEDGDVVSKSARDDLIELMLAGRVVVRGQQGYTAANYIGANVLAYTRED